MKILYLDTSSSFLYTGLVFDGQLITQIKEKLDKDLSTLALSKISRMFTENKITPDEINKIIVVNGPGSFTGVRIGLTIAKTFAWAKQIPIITISSLEAMALSHSKESSKYLVPAIDARRNYVFASIYDNENRAFVMNEQYINLNTLEAALENMPSNIKYITNDNLKINHEIITYDPDILYIVDKVKDRGPVNPHSIDANYLKLTEAEEKNDSRAS